jgi:hypothetical protein
MSARTRSLRIRRPRLLFPVIPAALLALGLGAHEGSALSTSSTSLTPLSWEGSATDRHAGSAHTPAPRVAQEAASTPDVERAEALEAEARALGDQMNRRARAARLYRQAAELRPADDPQKVTSLRHASRMNYYAGRMDSAIRDSHDASQVALRQGDLVEAAHAYLDAAWLAAREGKAERAEQWVEEARLLATSPLLAQAQQDEIRTRMRDSL